MQAILTKFMPQTNTKPGRIKAYCEAGSVVIGYPYEPDGQEASHRKAAEALRDKMEWSGELVAGALPDSSGYAFVFIEG